MSRRWLVALAGSLVALVLLELAAVPLASRLLSDAAARCVRHETFAVTAVDRPVLPRLVAGRARDVEVVATGLRIGELRVDRAQVSLPEVTLPWAPGRADVLEGRISVVLTEADLTDFVRSLAPVPLPVRVEVADDRARLRAPGLPVELALTLEVTADGRIDLAPTAGDAAVLERFGLALTLDPGDEVTVTELTLEDGLLAGAADLAVVPGLSDGQGCEEPL